MRRSRSSKRGLGVLALCWLTGCATERLQGPPQDTTEQQPAPFLVSPPTVPAASGAGLAQSSLTGEAFAYVSLRPGVVPEGVVAEIRNRSSGGIARIVFLFGGGFDPVAIPATAGDTLALTVRSASGNNLLVGTGVVPRVRPPVIVRANPPPGKRDVPLNMTLVVVFSEPINPATLNGSSLQLRIAGGGLVSGQLSLTAGGTRAEFVPSQPLAASTTYSVTLTSQLGSQSGGQLEPVSFDFISASATAGIGMSQLLFVGCPTTSTPGACGIFVMNADGSGVRQLTEAVSDNYDASPAWSPDGGRIAFSSYRHCPVTGRLPVYQQGPCQRELYTMNADGSGITRMTTTELSDGHSSDFPAWSPNGQSIAFTRGRAVNPSYALATVNADGSGFHMLLQSTEHSYGRPSWSPDGNRIALGIASCCISTLDPQYYRGLHIRNRDSTVTRVTTQHDGFPSWSPDGSRIAFQRAASGVNQLWTVRLNDGAETQLTTAGGLTPTWSPDGSRIAFKLSPGALLSELWVMNANGSGLAQLHSGWANLPAWSPFGTVPQQP